MLRVPGPVVHNKLLAGISQSDLSREAFAIFEDELYSKDCMKPLSCTRPAQHMALQLDAFH